MTESTKIVTVDVGEVSYTLQTSDGTEIATIRLNPADPAIFFRYQDAQERIKDIPDDIGFREMDETIRKELAYILGRDVSDLFRLCSPLGLMQDGSFFFEKILDVIGDIVSEAAEQRTKKARKRIKDALKDITGKAQE